MDIAELAFKVDSSGLVEGTKALDQNAAAADRAGGAAERLEREHQNLNRGLQATTKVLGDSEGRYARIARQAVEFAESMQGANVSERALAEATALAASGLDVRSRALARAGTEQERMAARAKALEEAEARLHNQQVEATRATQAQQINLKGLLGQIDLTVAALNRLAQQEERLEKARDLGLVSPQVFQQYQAQIDASRQRTLQAKAGLDQMGMSARQTAAALRMVPAQVTDIATSLASGQPAWMVAIQQGGQLKDQLGGLSPAAKAVGSYIVGLVNPLTVSGAALAALVVGLKQGQDELFELQKALILTGRTSEISTGQYEGLVEQLDKLAGVGRGQAVSALNAVASSGKFAGEQFAVVSEAAARMEASTGQAIAKTVSAFEEIAKDPLDALAKLNQQEGFLNRSQIERISALQEEGHEQHAVAEALALYARHLDEVADRSESVMPAMAKWWRDVKDEVSGAWGEVVTYASLLDKVIAKQQLASKFSIGDAASSVVGNTGNLAALLPKGWLSSGAMLANALGKSYLGQLAGEDAGQEFQVSADGRKAVSEYVAVLKEQKQAEEAASTALDSRMASLDRATAKQQAYNKIVELYNRIPESDARHFDGSMQKLVTQAYAQVDKQFDRRDGVGRKNADDNSAASLLASIQRQITANEQLADTGEKVTASDRLAIQTRQILADETNSMTASTRKLLQAILPELEASDAKAEKSKQTQRDLAAEAALTERLAQLEQLRREDAEADLMAIGRGADATEMLRRQLDIQRDYLREREKLEKAQRDPATALSGAAYQQATTDLEASLGHALDIERGYQQQRMAMLQDWRAGFTRVWEDYTFAAANASDQAAGLLTNGLSQAEDAFVRFVQTGKLSFKALANSIIADLARIASKQAITGLFGNVLSRWMGETSGVSSTYGAQSFGNNTDWLTGGLGGARATGGPVWGDELYRVGERGPETFEQGGKRYLVPGQNGRIVPAAASVAGGGGSAVQMKVEVNNYGGSQVQTRTTSQRMPDGSELRKLIIDIAGESLDGGELGSIGRQRFGWKETV